MSSPLVTVLMPMYNSEKYILAAVNSILNQTFSNFEFIIIDDASTDNSVEIIKSYKDPRIKLIVKPQNTGYTNSLNMGLKLATGKYIARMDSDDICVLNRFEKQVAFMESNKDVAVCGSWFTCIGTNEIIKHPVTHDAIKVAMLNYCAIGHPTVLMRKDFFKEQQLVYNTEMEPAEDYDLWCRTLSIGKLANLPEVLLYYRLHTQQVSNIKNLKQQESSNKICIYLLKQLKEDINYNIFHLQENIKNLNTYNLSLLDQLEILDSINKINAQKKVFNTLIFNEFIIKSKQNLVLNFLTKQNAFNNKTILFVLKHIVIFKKNVNTKVMIKYFIKATLC